MAFAVQPGVVGGAVPGQRRRAASSGASSTRPGTAACWPWSTPVPASAADLTTGLIGEAMMGVAAAMLAAIDAGLGATVTACRPTDLAAALGLPDGAVLCPWGVLALGWPLADGGGGAPRRAQAGARRDVLRRSLGASAVDAGRMTDGLRGELAELVAARGLALLDAWLGPTETKLEILAVLAAGRNLLLEGPVGSGKTLLGESIAAALPADPPRRLPLQLPPGRGRLPPVPGRPRRLRRGGAVGPGTVRTGAGLARPLPRGPGRRRRSRRRPGPRRPRPPGLPPRAPGAGPSEAVLRRRDQPALRAASEPLPRAPGRAAT